jgi:hypothetical protein
MTGFTGAGQRNFGAPVTEKARIEWMDKELKKGTDQVIRIAARVFLRPGAAVAANDRLGYGGANYKVESVTVPRDVAARADHVELMISEDLL